MVRTPPVGRMLAGVLLLLSLMPAGAAQAPALPDLPDPESAQGTALNFVAYADPAYLRVPFLGQVQTKLVLEDLTQDSGRFPGVTDGSNAVGHTTYLRVQGYRPEDAPARGWQVLLGDTFVTTSGGERREILVTVQTTPAMSAREVEIDLDVEFTHPSGYRANKTVTIAAEVDRYDNWLLSMRTPPQKAAQFQTVVYEVAVTNTGVYYDTYRFTATTDKAGFRISTPPDLYVPPGETRSAFVSVLTPYGKPYELGNNVVINIKAESLESGTSFGTQGLLQVRGPYLPVYWFPLVLVGLVAGAIVTHRVRERAQNRRLEKGLPRRVRPTPRQAVLLQELKHADPEAYADKRAKIAALYAARRESYRAHHKERVLADRAERKEARLELTEEKRRRKAERKALAKQLQIEKKAARKQAKIDKKEAKLRGKEEKKQAKALARKRLALEKRKGKLEAAKAKLEAKEAKSRAKADKAAAAAAKREARAARRREKSR